MRIDRSDRGEFLPPPEPSFIGELGICVYFRRPAPSRLAGAIVSFAPASRTPWKTNPSGQTIIVLSGTGWAGSKDAPVVEVRAGDMIWWSPGELHWEGATPHTAMIYLAIQEEEGAAVAFSDPVTDDEYHISKH